MLSCVDASGLDIVGHTYAKPFLHVTSLSVEQHRISDPSLQTDATTATATAADGHDGDTSANTQNATTAAPKKPPCVSSSQVHTVTSCLLSPRY